MTSASTAGNFGDLVRRWRTHRRFTQMELAGAANLSTRHLSFLETGRARPSRGMVIALAEKLAIPLRERNVLLTAAGYAPVYRERALSDPAMAAARNAVDIVLKAHEPFPALALDRHWNVVAQNAAVGPLLEGVDPQLLKPPVNVLRLSLNPHGLAPRIANLPLWRRHLLNRLEQQVLATADPSLEALSGELQGYGSPASIDDAESGTTEPAIVLPLQLHTPRGLLSFISTTTVFGTPTEVTLAELALEVFFPADEATARALGAAE